MIVKREEIARQTEDRFNTITEAERLQLIRDIDPPWSWIHQFASQNCREKSYNFLEEIASVASDETPSESSDESFDFEVERFIRPKAKTPSIDSCEVGVEDMLLRGIDDEEGSTADDADSIRPLSEAEIRTAQIVDINGIIDDILQQVGRDGWEADSLVSLVESKLSVTDPTAVDPRSLNIRAIIRQLKLAAQQRIQFMGLQDLKKYLALKLNISESDGLKTPDASVLESLTDGEQGEEDEEGQQPEDENESIKTNEESKLDENEAVDEEEAEKVPQLADKFDDCYIEIDEKVAGKVVPDQMIIGLACTPSVSTVVEVPSSPPTSVPPDSPTYVSSNMNLSDVTEKEFILSPRAPSEVEEASPREPPPFECTVPAMPGIGKQISRETIRNFLTYLEGRSRQENGMVFPRHWLEPKCPSPEDCYEG